VASVFHLHGPADIGRNFRYPSPCANEFINGTCNSFGFGWSRRNVFAFNIGKAGSSNSAMPTNQVTGECGKLPLALQFHSDQCAPPEEYISNCLRRYCQESFYPSTK
jgi:hypothetical protein